MTFYLRVYVSREPQLSLTDSKRFGEFESVVRSEFQARNGESKGSGVSRPEGYNIPFGVLDQH